MNPRYDARGTLSFWRVLPSKSLRALVYRKLRERFPQLNYCCEWNDKNGFGLNLTIADWVQPNRIYHVPN